MTVLGGCLRDEEGGWEVGFMVLCDVRCGCGCGWVGWIGNLEKGVRVGCSGGGKGGIKCEGWGRGGGVEG